MATQTLTERLTYEEWRKLPESNLPCEIVDGVIQMTPAPVSDHAWIADMIARLLWSHVSQGHLGVVLTAPVDVVVQKEPLRTRQPDVLFLNAERTGIRGRKELREMPAIEAPPELVVEVLSPSEARTSVLEKLEDYRAIGTYEAWLVSPEAETVEVLRLSSAGIERAGLFGAGDIVQSLVLPDLHLAVDDVFA